MQATIRASDRSPTVRRRAREAAASPTPSSAADSGNFDLTDRSVRVKGRCRETQRSPDARPDYEHTPIIGLRGATLVERYAQTVSIVTVAVGLSDSTRGGGTFTMKTCQ